MKIKTVRPMNNQILVKLLESNSQSGMDKTESGIFIHNATKPKGREIKCEILRLGTKFKDKSMEFNMNDVFNIGDVILVYAPSVQVKLDTEDHGEAYLIRAEDVVAKLVDNE